MGLSSKQVSSDELDWSQDLLKDGILETPNPAVIGRASNNQQQQQQQRMPALKCPRCESTNTKFCYFNNYSRSQPRYLCKACRRHWTEGGTLRNVPVGGARKPKRAKTSAHDATSAATATVATNKDMAMPLLPFPQAGESTIFPDVLRRVLLQPAPPLDYRVSSSFLEPLGSSPFQHQLAGIEPVATISYNISPFTLSSTPSSLVSEDFATVNGSSELGASWLQAPPELPTSTVGMGAVDASSCIFWAGWEDDITGIGETERTHTNT